MNETFTSINACLKEIDQLDYDSEARNNLFAYQVLRRLQKISSTLTNETDYMLLCVKKRVNATEGDFHKKAREIDKFSRATTGIAKTYLGFLSRLITEYFMEQGTK